MDGFPANQPNSKTDAPKLLLGAVSFPVTLPDPVPAPREKSGALCNVLSQKAYTLGTQREPLFSVKLSGFALACLSSLKRPPAILDFTFGCPLNLGKHYKLDIARVSFKQPATIGLGTPIRDLANGIDCNFGYH